jgi:Fe2+ transport system protein B
MLQTKNPSIVGHHLSLAYLRVADVQCVDIRTWHANIEQHASEGVNKILIGNKSDWVEKRQVTTEQGRALADELGIRFMETSAKVNEGVEDAFFTLARRVVSYLSWIIYSFSSLGISRLGWLIQIPRQQLVVKISRKETPSKLEPHKQQIMAAVKVTDEAERMIGRAISLRNR